VVDLTSRRPWSVSGNPDAKTVVLVAHDNMKTRLHEWAERHVNVLRRHDLVATGNTGSMLGESLGLDVYCVKSGPLGGDQQVGAMIAEGLVAMLVFFWDPLSSQPHDPDVKALLRLAVLYDVPTACNAPTADVMLSVLSRP